MVDESLGIKRTCPSCHARFYDLNKTPIECPKCGETFTVEPILPSKHDQMAEDKPADIAPEPVEEEPAGMAAEDDEVAAEDVDEAAAVAGVDLGDVADVEVSPDDDDFLETDDDDDAPVEDIIPVVKPEEE